ncbi:MAG TPA: HisA/HisF-related TIM barrel protein [Gemmatimonadales bacterium]|nr:HisA/HisF-related TIM barrel protein [Gemmatimonadales bacterium]
MIVPCIDLMGGRAVQLVRGRRLALEVADVTRLLSRFRRYRWLHVIDLDAALGRGSNLGLVRELCALAPMRVRVGGGVRTARRAEVLVEAGARQVIVGSRAFVESGVNRRFLRALRATVGRRRTVVALDVARGRITVRGWRARLPLRLEDVVAELEPFCAGFLCTDVDHEGTLRGTDLALFRRLRRLTSLPVVAAGGIRSRGEVRSLARLGMDAAVGMALYRHRTLPSSSARRRV